MRRPATATGVVHDNRLFPVHRFFSIDTLERAVKKAQVGNREKLDALRWLGAWAANAG